MLKLEGLDYRLTRVEVQMQERSDSQRNMISDAARRLQNVEGSVSRLQSVMDLVHDESTVIRASQSELKLLFNSQSRESTSAARGSENAPRFQVLLAGLNGLRTMTNELRREMDYLQKNTTVLANLTRSVESKNAGLASKEDLNRGLAAIRGDHSSPVFTLSAQSSRSCAPEETVMARDCSEAMAMGAGQSGIQQIRPLKSSTPFFVQCDMETRGGGWTVIHNRVDGVVNFMRNWLDYKHGFGNLATEFWMGLEKMHMITNQGVYELLIQLTDFGLENATAHYGAFAIGTEAEGYDLRLLGLYDGDAGDSLTYHASMKFSTHDMDQDQWPDGNCARDHTGGWWYRGCDTSNLNGQYLNGNVPIEYEYKGMYWYDYHGPMYSLLRAKMMIRPLDNASLPQNQSQAQTKKPKTKKEKKKKESKFEDAGNQN